jgi:hypothetical protein
MTTMYSIIKKNNKFHVQLENSSQRMLGLNTLRFSRLISDWSDDNMNPDVNQMLLSVT